MKALYGPFAELYIVSQQRPLGSEAKPQPFGKHDFFSLFLETGIATGLWWMLEI